MAAASLTSRVPRDTESWGRNANKHNTTSRVSSKQHSFGIPNKKYSTYVEQYVSKRNTKQKV